jgi:hypothetical protein
MPGDPPSVGSAPVASSPPTEPASVGSAPAEPAPARLEPDPGIDTVPGDPPVPINVWHLPPSVDGTVPAALVRRLVITYTRPGATIIDLTTSPLPSPDPFPAALIITQWPATGLNVEEPEELFDSCAQLLAVHGHLAVVVPTTWTVLGPLVAAARASGLTYLQHIVITHQLPRHVPGTATRPLPADRPQHPRIHSDLLLFRRTGAAHA